jgi:LysR family glycine cleavage system transcriptional activator
MLKRALLIHDESLASRAAIPTWADWFAAAGVRDADVSHGLRFSSADHALDATVEGAGVLLAPDALAYDDLRIGRLVMPFDLTLPSGRCYAFVCPKKQRESANVRAFRAWPREEAAALDWSKRAPRSRISGAVRGDIAREALTSRERKRRLSDSTRSAA